MCAENRLKAEWGIGALILKIAVPLFMLRAAVVSLTLTVGSFIEINDNIHEIVS